jgi:TPR repeat protein
LEAAVDAGLAAAYSRLGYYLDEHGEEADKAQALYERGALTGCTLCLSNWAHNAWEGACAPKDKARALALWSQAADLGDAQSTFECAHILMFGDGVPKDEARARTFLERAVAAGMLIHQAKPARRRSLSSFLAFSSAEP